MNMRRPSVATAMAIAALDAIPAQALETRVRLHDSELAGALRTALPRQGNGGDLQAEIAAHNAAVDAIRAEKRLAKLGRKMGAVGPQTTNPVSSIGTGTMGRTQQ
jgi:hypothetical protein